VLCDIGIFQLPLHENRTKRYCFTSEVLLISSKWVKNERKMMQMETHLLCVPVLAGNLGFKHCSLRGDHQKSPLCKRKRNQISASNKFSSSVLSVTEMIF